LSTSVAARTSLLAAGLILAPLAALPAQASVPGAAPALTATATRAADTGRAVTLGSLNSSRSLNLVVTLKAPHPAAEAAALRAMYTPGSSTFHHFLTPAQFTARWAPSPAAASSVTDYLAGHGFSHIQVLSNRMAVTAVGTASDATSAFHTRLASFQIGSLRFFANTSPALVPAAMSSSIQAVLGLNDIPLPLLHPVRARTQAGSPSFAGLTPAQFQTTYDAPGTPTGAGTSVALLTEGSLTQVLKDLRQAETVNHLPKVAVTEIPVGVQSSDTSGAGEFDLDTQSSTGMAATVKNLYLYNIGSLVDSQIDLDFATFVAQDKAVAMSASIGGCDVSPYLDGSMVSTDAVLQEGAMQGQTLFASTGDDGSACGSPVNTGGPVGIPGTNWPASGEFTTAVGGTSLITDSSGNRISELGWLGSGGGISYVENPGWWTGASDLGYDVQYGPGGGRALPDVALDADPNVNTPALIYVDGQVSYVGGTSLSSPLMLGAWARLQSAHKNHLGLASIDLYAVYDKVNPGTTVLTSPINQVVPAAPASPVAGFTDITLGGNGMYVARPGYDEVTGLGAPDIAALNKVIP